MSIYTSFPIFYGKAPPEGPRYVNVQLTPFVSLQSLSIDISQTGMASIQSAVIDNSANPTQLDLMVQDTSQIIAVPANKIVQTPIFTGGLLFTVLFQLGLNQTKPALLTLFNFWLDYQVKYGSRNFWYGSPQGFEQQLLTQGTVVVPANTWTQISPKLPNFTKRLTVGPNIASTSFAWQFAISGTTAPVGPPAGGPMWTSLGSVTYDSGVIGDDFPFNNAIPSSANEFGDAYVWVQHNAGASQNFTWTAWQ